MPQVVDISFPGFAQEVFELGEDLFDRVQVGRVGGQEQPVRASGFDGVSHRLAFVASQIVEHDDIAGPKRWHQELLDVTPEYFTIDRPIDHTWGVDPVMAQGGEEGGGAPVSMGNLGVQTLAARAPAPQGGHVGLGPCLVNEDQTGRINPALILFPSRPPAQDVRAILLGREYGFFYS